MTTSRPLTPPELSDLADRLRTMLAAVESGGLDATTAMRYRLEGALSALEMALGRPSSLLDDPRGPARPIGCPDRPEPIGPPDRPGTHGGPPTGPEPMEVPGLRGAFGTSCANKSGAGWLAPSRHESGERLAARRARDDERGREP